MKKEKRESGIALAIVLMVVLMLVLAVATFASRSVTDHFISQNRDNASQAAALARGGVRLATAVLFQSRVLQEFSSLKPAEEKPMATLDAVWAKIGESPITAADGTTLRIEIHDTGARFNLNSLVPAELQEENTQPDDDAEEFLVDLLDKIQDELGDTADISAYDPREMARNLLDYMDRDDTAIGGRNEDDYYLRQDPPQKAANGPLLSIGQLAMVEGFDAQFVRAMEPYVTVYPYVKTTGVNLNTAPPHVLGLVYHGNSGDMRMQDEELVRQILKARENDEIICNAGTQGHSKCVSLNDVGLDTGGIYPEPVLPAEGTVFDIRVEATVGNITKIARATLDISNYEKPLLLSWEMQ